MRLSGISPRDSALFGGMASLVGGIWAATASLDIIPIVGAVGVGLTGLFWSIYAAGRSRRAETIQEEADALRVQRDLMATDLANSQREYQRLWIENQRLEGRIARILEHGNGEHDPT